MFAGLFNYTFNKKSKKEQTYGALFDAYTKLVRDGKKIIVKQERVCDDLRLDIYKKKKNKKIQLGRIIYHFHSDKISFYLGECSGEILPEQAFYDDAVTLTCEGTERAKKLEETKEFEKQQQFNMAIQRSVQQATRNM